MTDGPEDRLQALQEYVQKFRDLTELELKLAKDNEAVKTMRQSYDKSERDLKSLQSVGQVVGEVLKRLDSTEKPRVRDIVPSLKIQKKKRSLQGETDEGNFAPNEASLRVVVKSSSGPRYVVGCKTKIKIEELTPGSRVALDMTTLTIMRKLPREVDPLVHNMLAEDPGDVEYGMVGGLNEQIRQLREVVELPLTNPELFKRVGIKSPKGVLLYGPPGTGKTLLARAMASNMKCNFMKVVASAIVDKYIGESARVIREMFGHAKENQPCIIFMDEIDAIGGRRFNQGTSADREIQRTLMELLNQMDGFDELGTVKVIMATNRPDVLDPALLRPGRLDRKIEIPIPTESARLDILKIHSKSITKKGDIDFEAIVKLADGFNGADLRNICTEAGMFAIRAERDYTVEEDYFKATRKIAENKKLEGKIDYQKI
eukprot:GHVP01065348.1.p1 GENE.GHVP01065348.1~~GHVP01065348.1.p1  ORF type:complete len:441 (-),score=80.84 GHVP01065348.1:481-1770(-)